MNEFAEALRMPAESGFVRKVNSYYITTQVKIWNNKPYAKPRNHS
jgi:hypothetical protein